MIGFSARADGPVNEYQVKAAFLFNFAKFVEWPDKAFANAKSPIYIGVLGDDPFGGTLDQIVEGETVQERKLIIKRSRQVEDLKGCHLLFISKSEKARIAQILTAVDDASVVTVSEVEGFARRGGVINFFIADDKVRFEVNADTARHKGLKISSQLLRVAGKERD